jgi:hypothetical protein
MQARSSRALPCPVRRRGGRCDLGLARGAVLSDAPGMMRVMPRLAPFDHAKLTATLDKQYGIISRHQASSCLMTDKTIRYRIRVDGPWQVVLPGVYRDGGGVLSDRQRAVAACLYAGRAIAVTGLAAVAWHGVKVKRPDFVDVLVRRVTGVATPGSLGCTGPAWSWEHATRTEASSTHRSTGRLWMPPGS